MDPPSGLNGPPVPLFFSTIFMSLFARRWLLRETVLTCVCPSLPPPLDGVDQHYYLRPTSQLQVPPLLGRRSQSPPACHLSGRNDSHLDSGPCFPRVAFTPPQMCRGKGLSYSTTLGAS